jgi:hypothetical protein
MTTKDDIQDQIKQLQVQLETLNDPGFDWHHAPVICEINGSRWVLGPESSHELNWHDAIVFCKSVDGELPPREVLLMGYLNEEVNEQLVDSYYWSITDFCDKTAWSQNFSNGNQSNIFKSNITHVRAVRKLYI